MLLLNALNLFKLKSFFFYFNSQRYEKTIQNCDWTLGNFLQYIVWHEFSLDPRIILATLPTKSMSLDPQPQNKNKCATLWAAFSVYIYESWTLGKLYGINLKCYWQCLQEQFGYLGNMMGTMKKTQNFPPLLRKKEKTGPLILSGCWAFSLAA